MNDYVKALIAAIIGGLVVIPLLSLFGIIGFRNDIPISMLLTFIIVLLSNLIIILLQRLFKR